VPRVRVDEQPRPRLAKFKTPATLLSYFGISILPGMVFLSISTGRTKMPDEPPSPTLDVALTTNIVAAYVRRNQIGADQLPVLISTVHQALSGLGKLAAGTGSERTPRCRSGDPFIAIMSSAWIAAVAGRCSDGISLPAMN
jgi:hypothetical protein